MTGRPAWRLDVIDTDPDRQQPAILQLALCHDVWRLLTERGRAALAAAHESDGWIDAHPLTRQALYRHGLADNGRITEAGTLVATYRPVDK